MFSEQLKRYRCEAGLTQRELAKRVGISTSAISMYELGSRTPDFEIEEKLADFFRVDLDNLRGRKSDYLMITDKEEQLILAYREKKDARKFVDKLLDL